MHGAAASGAGKGTLRSYITGFALAVLLTVVSFGLVMTRALPQPAIIAGIFMAAVVQILVHLRFFLHLDASSGERWNLLALTFTLVILVMVAGGSIWIMSNLRQRTMPPLSPSRVVERAMAPPSGGPAGPDSAPRNAARPIARP